jgi:hypothetical protein
MPMAIPPLKNVGEGGVGYTKADDEAPCRNVDEHVANNDEVRVEAPR